MAATKILTFSRRLAPSRGRCQQAGRRGQGHPRPQGPQRRPREELRRPDHQRRRHHRQGDRARGPVREPGRPARQGGRQQDQRRRRRRHHDRHRPGPGHRARGPAQRRRRRQPAGASSAASRRPSRPSSTPSSPRPARSTTRSRSPRSAAISPPTRRDRRDHRRGHGEGRQGRRHHRRGGQGLRHRAGVHRGHAVRQGLPLAVLRHRRRAQEAVLDDPYILMSRQEDLRPGPPARARAGHADWQAAADHRRGRRRRGPRHAGRQQAPRHLASVAVKAPGFGDRRKAMLQDIAILTGGTVITEEVGLKLENVTLDLLGRPRWWSPRTTPRSSRAPAPRTRWTAGSRRSAARSRTPTPTGTARSCRSGWPSWPAA